MLWQCQITIKVSNHSLSELKSLQPEQIVWRSAMVANHTLSSTDVDHKYEVFTSS